MDEEKLVSIIIPTYKRAETLPRAIKSVLKQKYNNIEVIIVDDNVPGSDHRKQTEIVMENFLKKDCIIYLQHEKNKNGSAARNTGFKHSKGDYIMFLDDDDEFINNKIAAQVAKLESLDHSWGACYANYIRKRNGKIVVYGAEKREGNLLKQELMRNLFIHAGSNLMVRREVIEEIGGFDESFNRNQDIEFMIRILVKYKLAFVKEQGLVIHISKNVFAKKKFEEITENYLKNFFYLINEFDEDDKKDIYKMINLQLLRNYLVTKGKRKEAVSLIKKNKLDILIIIRYFFYLLNRRITKKAYGFTIK